MSTSSISVSLYIIYIYLSSIYPSTYLSFYPSIIFLVSFIFYYILGTSDFGREMVSCLFRFTDSSPQSSTHVP